MLIDYFVPLGALAGTYIRVGMELWGSKAIGEATKKQEETVKSKRRVSISMSNHSVKSRILVGGYELGKCCIHLILMRHTPNIPTHHINPYPLTPTLLQVPQPGPRGL